MKYILLVLLITLGCYAKAKHPKLVLVHSINGIAQGTTYSIKYYGDVTITKESIDSLLMEIDNSMSIYKDYSIISTFNNPNITKVKMDKHLKAVVDESFRTYELTNGYFDITVMPLVNLWGFGSKGFKNNPSYEEVKEAKSLVGMKFLSVKKDYLIKKKKGVSIDVNGIAQGYSVDILGNYLSSKNINNYIIELGGEIITRGSKPEGDFVVEIQRPQSGNTKSAYRIKLKDKAITTSGSYEKRRIVNGNYVTHHIDPETGYPIESQTLSVTVIANSALKADAIDNYLMFIDPKKIIQFIENQKDMEVYVVYVENNTLKELQSFGFNNYIYK